MMKLRYNPTFPYVHKYGVLIEEVGLGDWIECVMNIGLIAIGSRPKLLDFRHPDHDW